MTLIEQIKRDREAGTPGPWHAGKDADEDTGFGWFVGGGGYCRANLVGPIIHTEANARRIARVPDMEAALLAADELAAAASWLADSSQLEIGHDYDDGKDPLSVISNALTAYRAAVSGAAT